MLKFKVIQRRAETSSSRNDQASWHTSNTACFSASEQQTDHVYGSSLRLDP
jgi:hypothetical protein